jgi:excisionase family DNA binding protein
MKEQVKMSKTGIQSSFTKLVRNTWKRNATDRSRVDAFLATLGPLATKTDRLSLAEEVAQIEGAITADKLAKLLSVSKITIFKMAKAGRIPSFRVGTCVRFDPRKVADWLRKV